MDRFWQDLRYAGRTLAKSPGFLTVAVLSLGLGIGANTAIFSLINTVMLRQLPVAHPEQLVLLTDPGASGIAVETRESGERTILSYPEFEQLRAHNAGIFSGMFAAQSALSELDVFTGRSGSEQSTKAHVQLVSGEFFGVLGIQPILGRVFTPQEDRAPGANPVAVISHGFWQREFGGDRAVAGRTIRVGQSAFQILGVAPAGFDGIILGSDADLWVPITMQAQVLPGRNYLKPVDTLWLQVMGRLNGGMSRKTAEAGVNVALQQILQGGPAALPTEKERQHITQRIVLRDGGKGASEVRGQFSDPLVLLMAMVGLVLLIACANVANLMLARASGRQREIGVRVALGASRARVMRQLLTESILVAALGGTLGTLLAAWGTGLLLALVSRGVTDLALPAPYDYRVFFFTAAVSLLTGVLSGLAPAIGATHWDAGRTLAANARGSIGGRGRVRTGRMLVSAQVALSLLSLMGAALFVRSLHNMMAQKLGYNRDGLLIARLDPVSAGYKGASLTALYGRLREKLLTIPGVRDVTLSNSGLFGGDAGDSISLDSPPLQKPSELRSRWTMIGPNYFKTVGIPLVRGREIDAADAAHGAQVCVVNEKFARFFFGNSDPIGKHVTDEYPTTRETFEIVGIVANTREHQVDEQERPRFYANLFHPIGTVEKVSFLLATPRDPSSIAAAVRHSIAEIDRSLPVLSLRTLNEQIDRRLITQRLIAELSAFFGGLALLMAAIGLYGVMSYSISKRTSEIGIRMALGASEAGVIWMVLRETLWLVAIGVAVGLPCALASGRLIANRLFGLSPADPATIAIAILIILGATMLAGYMPARRASHIDPMRALRDD